MTLSIKSAILAAAGAVAALSFGATPASAETFNGPYVGASIGYNHDRVQGQAPDGTAITATATKDAVDLGAYAGYNYKLTPRIVIGAEGDVGFTTSDRIGARTGATSASIDPQRQFGLSVRAGYLVDDKTLVYARGGYTNLRARTTLATGASTVRDLDGYHVGGGVERAITDHISARIEYRYNNYDNDGSKYERHQALFGVSYNF